MMKDIQLHKSFGDNVAITFWNTGLPRAQGTTVELTAKDLLLLQRVLAEGRVLSGSYPPVEEE